MDPGIIIGAVIAVFVILIAGSILIYCLCCKTDGSEERRKRIKERQDRIEEAKENMNVRSAGSGLAEDPGGPGSGHGSGYGRSGLSWDGNVGNDGQVKSRIEYDYDRMNGNNYNNNNRYYKKSGQVSPPTGPPIVPIKTAPVVPVTSGGSGFDDNNNKAEVDREERRRRRRARRRRQEEEKKNAPSKSPSESSNAIDTPSYQPPPSGSHSIVLFRRPSTDTFLSPSAGNSGVSRHLSQLRYKSPNNESSKVANGGGFDVPPPPARKKVESRSPDFYRRSKSPESKLSPLYQKSRRDKPETRRTRTVSDLKQDSGFTKSGFKDKESVEPIKEYKVTTMKIKKFEIVDDKDLRKNDKDRKDKK